MRNPHAGEPFTDSDDEIAAALQDVSVPALLLSCVHMTEDDAVRRDILDGSLRPAGIFLNEVQGFMSEEAKAAARSLALDVIRDYRDRGCPEPAPIDRALLMRMMNWIVAGEVADEYVPMMLEEMGLDGRDARGDALASDPRDRSEFPVIVIGAGQSGLLAAIRLTQAGIPFTVRREEPGGRRDMVGEQLSRSPGRCRKSLLLLQLRAVRPLDGVLRPATGATDLLLRRRRPARAARPHSLRHHRQRRNMGR